MYIIKIKIIGEDDYNNLFEKGKLLTFVTEQEAKKYGKENIENKKTYINSWFISEYITILNNN